MPRYYLIFDLRFCPWLYIRGTSIERGMEGQPQQFLVLATFSSFSPPSHLIILVLSILFFLVSTPPRSNYFKESGHGMTTYQLKSKHICSLSPSVIPLGWLLAVKGCGWSNPVQALSDHLRTWLLCLINLKTWLLCLINLRTWLLCLINLRTWLLCRTETCPRGLELPVLFPGLLVIPQFLKMVVELVPPWVCWYHRRWGVRASQCWAPSSRSEN